MLRSVSLLFAAGLACATAFGQSYSGLGAKAGVQMATFRSSAMHFDPLMGGVAGLYMPLNCGARFELQPELLVSAQGAALVTQENTRREWRSFYAVMPLTAKVYLTNAFNLQGGVQGAKLLAMTENGTDVKGQYKKMDAALVFGLGVDLMSGWDLTFRYTSGLTTISVDEAPLFATNRTWQFSAGYRFMRLGGHGRGRSRH